MIIDEYKKVCEIPGDINENLHHLMELTKECKHVTEMGVRGIVSTWAFMEGLKGRNGKLISIDILEPSYYRGNLARVEQLAKEEGINFKFYLGNTLFINIDPTDLLFIDTEHTYKQLKRELEVHAKKVNKYIVFHDTVSCFDELLPAINEFLFSNPEWKIKAQYTNNNGLMIIERC